MARFSTLLVRATLLALLFFWGGSALAAQPNDGRTEHSATETAEPDPLADIKAVARAAFLACLEPNATVAFRKYLDLIHPDNKETSHQRQHIERFQWKKFRGGCHQWFKDEKLLDFVIEYTQPREIPPDAEQVKVFFQAQRPPEGGGPTRYPAPMDFKRSGNRWMIHNNSL
jgi:hypothetical protein